MTDNSQALMMALQAGSLYGPNKWSQFPNGIQSTSYSGTPTNALGQPIQQPPGMTLNQTPAQPQAQSSTPAQQPMGLNFASLAPSSPGGPSTQAQYDYNLGLGGIGPTQSTNPGSARGQAIQHGVGGGANYFQPTASQPNGMPQGWNQNSNNGGIFITPTQQSQPQQQAAAAAPQQASSPVNSYQNALQLLSNPGHVTTPGANVTASQPITQQPSVLDQFLATQHGGTGAGGYSNTGFFDTLNKLKSNNASDANTAPAALSPGANMTDQLAGVKPQVRRA